MDIEAGSDPVDRYVAAWTAGNLPEVRRLLGPGVKIESNFCGSGDSALGVLVQIAGNATIVVAARVQHARRSIVLYDCTADATGGRFNFVEFLELECSRISGIRQVHDVAALSQIVSR